MSQYQLGLAGEQQAEAYLIKRGYRILQRRFRSRHGEIDLIANRGSKLVFIEVKYRGQGRLGEGIQGITAEKQHRLQLAISDYLAKQPQAYELTYLEITRAGILLREDILHEH